MSGRTLFWPKDLAWWRRQRVVAAGLACERAPAILDWLTCEAKAQAEGDRDECGWVKSGYAAIAHGACFGHATAEDARTAVSHLVRVGLLDDFEEAADGIFTARISGWREDVFLKLEAARAARRRATRTEKPAAEPKDDTERSGTKPAASRDVPPSPPQERTAQEDEEEEARASARPPVVHPQLADVMQRLAVVDGLPVEELAVNQALQRADRDGADVLDLADATVSLALDYSAAGNLRTNGASTLMHRALDRRKQSAAAQLAAKSSEVRATFEGRGRPARRRSAEERAAELDAKAAMLREQEQRSAAA